MLNSFTISWQYFWLAGIMKVFDIKTSSGFSLGHFFIRPVIQDNNRVYEVWLGDTHRFSLERNKKRGIGLILTSEYYLDQQIDKNLVQEISTAIQLHYIL